MSGSGGTFSVPEQRTPRQDLTLCMVRPCVARGIIELAAHSRLRRAQARSRPARSAARLGLDRAEHDATLTVRIWDGWGPTTTGFERGDFIRIGWIGCMVLTRQQVRCGTQRQNPLRCSIVGRVWTFGQRMVEGSRSRLTAWSLGQRRHRRVTSPAHLTSPHPKWGWGDSASMVIYLARYAGLQSPCRPPGQM